jgi:hypothetical protein
LKEEAWEPRGLCPPPGFTFVGAIEGISTIESSLMKGRFPLSYLSIIYFKIEPSLLFI